MRFELPAIGILTLKHAFYVLGNEPILFVCEDGQGSRYLCSCCRLHDEWAVVRTTEKDLLDLIDGRIPIRSAFETGEEKPFLVTWNGERFDTVTVVADRMLPKPGAFLELDDETTAGFRKKLEKTS